MRTAVIDYLALMEISRLDKENRERRGARHIKLQMWAARHGYRFWSRLFNLIEKYLP